MLSQCLTQFSKNGLLGVELVPFIAALCTLQCYTNKNRSEAVQLRVAREKIRDTISSSPELGDHTVERRVAGSRWPMR